MASTAVASKTFIAGAAITKNRLVTLSGTTAETVVQNGTGGTPVGVCELDYASGARDVAVRLWSPHQTCKVEAAGAITANANVFAGANGTVASSGTVLVGRALQAASGAGSVIEILPL